VNIIDIGSNDYVKGDIKWKQKVREQNHPKE
jgi:hypothetical protein